MFPLAWRHVERNINTWILYHTRGLFYLHRWISNGIMAWINNYVYVWASNKIIPPCLDFNCDLVTVYPKKYAHGFVVLCFVVVMQSFILNSHEVFIHIHQGCFAGTGAIVRLPQCQWSKPDGHGKISQCITTTKHSKAVTVCIFLGIFCKSPLNLEHGWVITAFINTRMQLLIHILILINLCP